MPNHDAFEEGDDDLLDAEREKPIASDPLSFRPRILLAEDEPDHQLVISHMLRDMGADVITVDNGRSAVDRALQATGEGNPFDLILMDIRMPVMGGCLATRRLRDAGYRLPIVALTANAMTGNREKFIAVGGDDYVTKPLVEGALVDLVRRWAKRARPRIAPE